jgi:alkylation response protein AidB-like acyl-CoA dehydrogenase
MYPAIIREDQYASWLPTLVTDLEKLACDCEQELADATREGRFSRDVYGELGKLGYLAPFLAREDGGVGLGTPAYVAISEEIGRHGIVSGQLAAQGQRWLLDWGTAGQKDQWLRGIARGELVFSESISEKATGSSFKNMRASARRHGSDWVLSGAKTHVNLGAESDVTLFYAMSDEGLTSFLVDMRSPGITTRHTDPIGLRLIPTADVDFDEVVVPNSALLGHPGGGMETFLSTFNISRLGNASELLGLGRRALTYAINYARERRVADNIVTDFQGLRWMIADSWSALQGAALARDHAALISQSNSNIALETGVAKRLAIVFAEQAVSASFSLVGGHGLYTDTVFAGIANDVRVLKVAGGSSEVLRNHIAQRVLRSANYEGIA